MVRQLGVFLYDTLSYPFDKCKDLEDYLSQEEIPTPTEPKRVQPFTSPPAVQAVAFAGIMGSVRFARAAAMIEQA